jgi:hypothetical protein
MAMHSSTMSESILELENETLQSSRMRSHTTVRLTDLLSQIRSKSVKTDSEVNDGDESKQDGDNFIKTERLSELDGNILHLLV